MGLCSLPVVWPEAKQGRGNGNLLQRDLSQHALAPRTVVFSATINPQLHQRPLDTHRQVWLRLLWEELGIRNSDRNSDYKWMISTGSYGISMMLQEIMWVHLWADLRQVSDVLSEKAMAPHSSTLAWKIPWVEEPGGRQSIGSLRVGHDWATSLSLFTFIHWRRKWQPTPVFLPGESQGRQSLVSCHYGVAESQTRLKQLRNSDVRCPSST